MPMGMCTRMLTSPWMQLCVSNSEKKILTDSFLLEDIYIYIISITQT